jgi:predicted dehydrogenase
MILVIGLGSMGKRRIRCLQALGYGEIIGYDPRQDRRDEAAAKYGVEITDTLPANPSTVIISTPPKYHRQYAERYQDFPTFIEAGTEFLDYGTPSATMLFNPMVQHMQKHLPEVGKILNITYHCGQYLPDWHPYEHVKDFYAGEAGAIEMVAFELMWFTKLFGLPNKMQAMRRETTEIDGLKAPDTFCVMMDMLDDCIVSLMVDVVARKPIRQLVINGSEAQLKYDLNIGVSEQMYIDETKAFMDKNYPNTLEHSNAVIRITKGLCA